ncbi:MAG TPA: Crp/Fnr family transcriptional regulator [Noviherbaspirillum sp.]|jgi:CRP-like cAMP-binding protein|uniref:Crp/Fnr family transcriptional regulator n=1 Tax=Noviherbaspirillum sp. TaxID=1926288 RepID=UPI002DDDB7F0|nr:Crp/Fnr family transcriptional regulator [Noviherbaspirillum sp.]HEV2611848.1 Crp/Fnr family transcriptional regulator [Noviherbaspirillum sp.]
MKTVPQSPAECTNILLSLLPEKDYQALLPYLEYVETPMHTVLFERNKPIHYAYFPLIGEHSILATMENGAAVEVGTVGFEGFSTVDLILGSGIATESTVCQIPGNALRLPAGVFKEMTAGDTPLRRITLRYLSAYLSQVSQSVACNRLHATEQRLARWLLMSHDRMQQQEFQITQEYLAMMLGVHRPSVSLVATTLQRAGLIDYKRGRVKIIDREGLEDAACECYGLVRAQFQRLLGSGFG